MYDLAWEIGFYLQGIVWALLLLQLMYTYFDHWSNDFEEDKKESFFLNRIAIDFDNGYIMPWNFIFMSIGAVPIPVILLFFFLNFFVPVAIVILIGLAFLTRMVKRLKKAVTTHTEDKTIHRSA